MTLTELMKTEYWKKIRIEVLNRDNHMCRICNERATHVHHSTYSYPRGEEHKNKNKLISLCGKCHELFHDIVDDTENTHNLAFSGERPPQFLEIYYKVGALPASLYFIIFDRFLKNKHLLLKDIEEATNFSRSKVSSYIAILKKEKLLTTKKDGKYSYRYTLNLP